MASIKNYTGQEIIQTAKRILGRWTATEIANDISVLGDNSIMGLARQKFTDWASACSVTDADQTDLAMALRWYTVLQYWNHHMASQDCECSKEDYRFRAYAEKQVCQHLYELSSCMLTRFTDYIQQKDKPLTDNAIPHDLFEAAVLTSCGIDTDIFPYDERQPIE